MEAVQLAHCIGVDLALASRLLGSGYLSPSPLGLSLFGRRGEDIGEGETGSLVEDLLCFGLIVADHEHHRSVLLTVGLFRVELSVFYFEGSETAVGLIDRSGIVLVGYGLCKGLFLVDLERVSAVRALENGIEQLLYISNGFGHTYIVVTVAAQSVDIGVAVCGNVHITDGESEIQTA